MGHLTAAVLLLAVAIFVGTWLHYRRKTRELKFHIERHGLRLRDWRRVREDEKRDPWRCPECLVTVHGHWAKVGHKQYHDRKNGREVSTEPWDSVTAEFLADRAAGTPELPDPDRPGIGPGDG